MAKVLFILDSLDTSKNLFAKDACNLICALHGSQHDIAILSSYNAESENEFLFPESIKVFRPFEKWSLIEVFKTLPLVLQINPDIIHFVQTEKKMKHLYIKKTFVLLIENLLRPLLVTSYYSFSNHIQKQEINSFFLKKSHLIFVNNLYAKTQLEPKNHPHQKIQLLPQVYEKNILCEDSWVSKTLTDYIYFAEPLSLNKNLRHFFYFLKQLASTLPDVVFLFADGWGDLTKTEIKKWQSYLSQLELEERVLTPSNLSSEQKNQLIKNSQLVVLSHVINSITFDQTSRKALYFSKPLLINFYQANNHPFPWRKGLNCFICKNSFEAQFEAILVTMLKESSLQQLTKDQITKIFLQMNDTNINQINRSYNEALHSLAGHSP